MKLQNLKDKLFKNSVLIENDQFVIKFAETEEEVEKALRLRYKVFNLERGKGICTNEDIDRDEFDDHCLHLVIFDKDADKAVGTYRMHFGSVAMNHELGLYSAREFELDGIEDIIENSIEVGRSCVSPEYRDGSGVGLMWGAIARVLQRSGCNFLMGCVSVEKTDPALGWALYEYLKDKGSLSEILTGVPTKKFELERPSQDAIDEYLKDIPALRKEIPPLFKGYLRLGSKVCATPVIDKEFGTIDFLILMDYKKMPERYWRHFVEK